MRFTCKRSQRDRGSILVLTLVMAVVLSVTIAAIASYVTSGLKYSRVVEDRADRLAAADGGLRYAIERLQNSAYAACLSNLGNTGYTIDFPAQVNGSNVSVTCTKGASGIGDIKAWAIIVTGEGVPNGQPMFESKAGGGIQKLLGGPVWITDPDISKTNLQAPVTVQDGDIWYYRPDCTNSTLTLDPNLKFTPSYRGPICVQSPWSDAPDVPGVFPKPVPGTIPAVTNLAATNPAPTVDAFGCTIFSPGRYTIAPAWGANTYMKSGNYYFHNLTMTIQNAVVTAGWADFFKYGDQQAVPNYPCGQAMVNDSTSGSAPGATFYMGGSSKFIIDNKGSLEIMRRLQGDDLVSMQTMDTTTADYTASNLAYNQNIIYTKSGNNTDLAIHGLLWAPKAQLEFGNVTNAANGQLLGGAAVAHLILQASASATAFVIRVESSPIDAELKIDSTATKNGVSTTMRAVVQVDIDDGKTAVNSLRVLGL